ncbi:MAG TPA: murein biosynthesis integral membrane protein MurJ [Ktedonobacteraceae bacterium]|nr:murein biosynthesis integral membrane protein MurJ [Ktedonobacteraceae bacterium]
MAKKPVKNRSQSSKVTPTEDGVWQTSNAVVPPDGLNTSGGSDTSVPTEQSLTSVTVVVAGSPEADAAMSPIPVAEHVGGESLLSERRHIVKSATLVMLGNLGSSLMGMVRQLVVAALGASISGPFFAAGSSAQTFNDFLINGSVNGALIPTFNDYAAPEQREELRRIVFTVLNLVLLVMCTATLIFLLISPWFVYDVLVPGYQPAQKLLTLQFAQIIFCSLIILGPFAVLQAALFARKEFGWPAVATAAYHVGIIIGAGVGTIVGDRYLGQYGIAFGVLLGAAGEIGLLVPGLRNQRLRYQFVLDLKHPALRRILKLYGPVAFSFLASAMIAFLDLNLASRTPGHGDANYTAMRLATTLIQFPGGLVATALSVAVLPTLTKHARSGDSERFKATLLLGFRLGLLLMIPAAAGLIVLRTPIVDLLFLHGHYTPEEARLTAIALQNYSYQLPFVAMDQLLIAAFYARKNTITPVVVGVVSFLGYLAVALPFWQTIGMPALAFANTVQNSLHAIILLVLLRLAIGPLRVRETLPALVKILVATAAMVAVAWSLQLLFTHVALFSLDHLLGRLLVVIVAGSIASLVYIGGVILLRVEEVRLVKVAVLAKLGR